MPVQDGAPVEFVQPLEQGSDDGGVCSSVPIMGSPAEGDIEAGRFRRVVAFVVQVGFVDGFRDAP